MAQREHYGGANDNGEGDSSGADRSRPNLRCTLMAAISLQGAC